MNYCSIAYTIYDFDQRVKRYADVLIGPDNRVDVIVLKHGNQKTKETSNGVNIYRTQKKRDNLKGPISYLLDYLRFFIVGSLLLLVKQIRHGYDVIHVHNLPDFLVFMALIPKLMGAKIILDIHDILPEFYCQKFGIEFTSFKIRLLLLVERISIRFADHVIVSNDLWRTKIINRTEISPHKCTTILNYPCIEFYENVSDKSTNNEFSIIYPGTVSQHHGVDIAVKALACVREKIPNVRLHICLQKSYLRSSNNYHNSLILLCNRLNLRNNVKFFEPVPVDQLGKIFKSVDLGVVPKRAGIFSSEAFSTKILEFMAAGLPTAASKTTVDQYYFDDSMIMFFEPGNHKDLARCIIEFFEKPWKGEFIVKNAKKFVAKNNWELKKGIFYKIISDLLI
jgi:glycosyltransferase involved in cell wall biosynthesis